jgi:transcriptional regulator with XRE-family HTH domain
VVIYNVDEFARISLKRSVYKAALTKLGQKIRSLREAQGISQENFAQLASIERARYGKIERGEANISANVIFRLAHHLKVHPSELFADVRKSDCVPSKEDA